VDMIAQNLVARQRHHDGSTFWDSEAVTDKARNLNQELQAKGQLKKNQIVLDKEATFSDLYLPITIPDDTPEGTLLRVAFTVTNSNKTQIELFLRKVTMSLNNEPIEQYYLSSPQVKDRDTQHSLTATFPVKAGEIVIPSLNGFRGAGYKLITCTLVPPTQDTPASVKTEQ